MSTPPTVIYAEPTNRTLVVDWTPNRIRQAEFVADTGDLRLAAELCDAMLADDAVQAVLDNRVLALLGCNLLFEEGQGRRKKAAKKALEAEEDFFSSFPEDTLTDFLKWSVLLNCAPGILRWKTVASGRVLPFLESWHPRYLRFDLPTRGWKIRVNDGTQEVDFIPGDGTWIFHTPRGRSRPWMNAAWRAVSRWWLLKHYAKLDWGRYSDRQGQGLFVGTAPEQVKKENRIELAKDLQNLGRVAGIALPPGYDIKLVESTAKTWETFQAQIAAADKGITVALTGLNMTNEAGGSYAKAESLGGIRYGVLRGDGNCLSTTLHDQALVWWAEFNFGSRKLAPWPYWKTDPPEDAVNSAAVTKTRAEAAATLASIGTFTVNEVRVAAGHDPIEDGGDEIVKKEPAATPADVPAQSPAPAPPAEPPAKQLSLADVDAKLTVAFVPLTEMNQVLARTIQAAKHDTALQVDTLKASVKATAEASEARGAQQVGSIMAVREKVDALANDVASDRDRSNKLAVQVASTESIVAIRLRSGRSVPSNAGMVQGQLYADELADNAHSRAAKILDPDVVAVLEAIDGGESYEDIRARLVKTFKGMSPSKLAKLTEATITMATLGGRHAINEDDDG